jgi:ADP-ribosyl-[dinitrogen reductase] hydrolase
MCNALLGTAIGDALGVPFESKLSNYELLLNWDGKTYLGSEHHKLEPGQFSDDTQMSLMVAESLILNSGFNPDDLAARYVEWMGSGRARGWGKTTLAAVQNLMSGKHWSESGIVGSTGNGTAMRAAPFGIYFRDDLDTLVKVVKIDSAITHASEDAEAGALAIALAAAYACRRETDNLLEKIHSRLPDSKVKNTIFSLESLINSPYIPPAQALQVLGTKANVTQTVPSALYCFLKCKGFWDGVETAIRAGSDTDTTAAIVGALFGARDGTMDMLSSWFDGIEDYTNLIKLDRHLYNRTKLTIDLPFFPRS